MEEPKESDQWSRRIKSFVMRAGRTTAAQQKALEELGPQYLIPFVQEELHWDKIFTKNLTQSHPSILEIGFGMGETTAHIALLRPQDNFLAIEVHEPGVGALLKKIGEEQITNLKLIRHDAVEVIEHMIRDTSLDGVHIFFPDPWHKKRHNKRRLVQPEFIHQLCQKLKPGAYIHLATDWQEYAQQMLEVLSHELLLKNTSISMEELEDGSKIPGYADRPSYRPITKFEKRGLRLGHGVWDLVFLKV